MNAGNADNPDNAPTDDGFWMVAAMIGQWRAKREAV